MTMGVQFDMTSSLIFGLDYEFHAQGWNHDSIKWIHLNDTSNRFTQTDCISS